MYTVLAIAALCIYSVSSVTSRPRPPGPHSHCTVHCSHCTVQYTVPLPGRVGPGPGQGRNQVVETTVILIISKISKLSTRQIFPVCSPLSPVVSHHPPGCRDVRMCPGSGPGVVYSVLCNVYCVMCNVMCNAGGHHSRYQHPAIISSQSDISTSRHPGPGHSYEYSSSLYFVLYTSMYVVSGTSMIQVCSFSIYLLKWILIKHSQWTIYLYEFVISDVYKIFI